MFKFYIEHSDKSIVLILQKACTSYIIINLLTIGDVKNIFRDTENKIAIQYIRDFENKMV